MLNIAKFRGALDFENSIECVKIYTNVCLLSVISLFKSEIEVVSNGLRKIK